MKPYPSYKESNIDWIGNTPTHWNVCKLKRITQLLYGNSLSKENRNYGKIPVFGSNGIVDYHDHAITKSPCIVIGRKGSFGKVNYSETECYPIDTTYYIDKTATHNNIRWLYFLLLSLRLDAFSKDSAVPGLGREDAYEKMSILPPLIEQQAIATFLDQKTTQIDTLIAKKQSQIELLQEQRIALINQAVTKGTNPSVLMKDSGVQWLGEIPYEWYLLPLRRGIDFLTDFEANGSFSDIKENVIFDVDDEYAWYVRATDLENDRLQFAEGNRFCTKETYDYLKKTRLFGGELLVTKRGEIGKVYLMPEIDKPATLGPNLYLIRLNEKLLPAYAFYWFSCGGKIELELANKSTTIGALYKDDVKNCLCLFPPIDEQIQIVEFLQRELQLFSSINEKMLSEINLLLEYRTALISAAVTGKIDVRDKL